MEVKSSEAQGRHREVGSEGNVEQRYGLMDKNRYEAYGPGERANDREAHIHQGCAGGKSGGRVWKAVELVTGDLLHVTDW